MKLIYLTFILLVLALTCKSDSPICLNRILIKEVETIVKKLKSCQGVYPGNPVGKGGETYVRWGRTVCPKGAKKIYNGYAAGSHYALAGSGANYLCLPKNPEWGQIAAGQGRTGRIYGVQYAVHDGAPYAKAFDSKDMPCAVCLTKNRPTVLMVPAKKSCPKGWEKEFSGYLMSQSIMSGRTASQYICVDKSLETVNGVKGTEWQSAIFPVEVACNRLDCRTYPSGWELTCAVCSM